MKAFVQLTVGTLLLCAYAAGSGLATDNKPHCESVPAQISGLPPLYECSGWTQQTYNSVHVGSRGFLVVGLVFLAVGLISYARRPASKQRNAPSPKARGVP